MTIESEVMAAPTALVRSLDRCDRCGAEARVRVVMIKSNLPLLFCAHHYGEISAALDAGAIVTNDERLRVDA